MIQAFHDLLEEERDKGLRRAGDRRAAITWRRPSSLPAVTLHPGVTSVDPAVRRRLCVAVPASAILHAAGAGAIVDRPVAPG